MTLNVNLGYDNTFYNDYRNLVLKRISHILLTNNVVKPTESNLLSMKRGKSTLITQGNVLWR